MKSLLVICFLGLVTHAIAGIYDRGCIYVEGRCYEGCPEGTHSYTTGCGRKMPEATCDQPQPELEPGNICDYSACYCDSPTLRDTKTNKCVLKEDCSKSHDEGHGHGEGHSHEGHSHEGHNHEGHSHEGHSHEGHSHGPVPEVPTKQ